MSFSQEFSLQAGTIRRVLKVTSTEQRGADTVRWRDATSGHWDRIELDRFPKDPHEWAWVAENLLTRLAPDGTVTMPGAQPFLSAELMGRYLRGAPMTWSDPGPTVEPNPDMTDARLARAEQTIDLLLRMLHAHGEHHLEANDSFDTDELLREWNTATSERYGHLPEFRPWRDN